MSVPSWAIPTEEEQDVPSWAIPSSDEGPPGVFQSIFPSSTEALNMVGGVGGSERLGMGAIGDVSSFTNRAIAAATSDQEMSDPNAYPLRPLVDMIPESMYQGRGGIPKPIVEFAASAATDPMLLAGPAFRGIKSAAELGPRFAGSVKRGIESLSQHPQALIDRAVSPQGMQELRDAAIKSEGGNMYPQAEELAQRLEAVNKGRTAIQEGTEGRRLTQFEEGLGETLNRPGVLMGSPSRGTNITETVSAAKTPMQEAFTAGDKGAVGPLRERGVSTYDVPQTRMVEVPQAPGPYGEARPPKIVEQSYTVQKKDVTKGLSEVLKEFKALSPEQGVPKITRGASGALKSILGLADKQANNIDDLINLKSQLRSVHGSGGFEGNIFDASVDDLAFAKSEEVINRAIEKAIAKADPKKAGQIISLMRANNQQYAQTKDLLSGLSNSMGRIENSDRVISKVAALGPKRSRELIEAGEKIPALKPVVEELRQGFVDDLILSASKGGKIDPASFAKRWNDARTLSPELKSVWLTPEQIARIDEAVKTASIETGSPSFVGEKIFGSTSKPSIQAGARRLENIGADANRDAAKELAFIDNLLGLKGDESYLKQATDVFEGKQLGMTKEGNLPITPVSRTGRSVLGSALGDVIGGILGGGVGLVTGGLSGAATGAILGAGTKRGLQVGIAYSQSPAGAVAFNRILNKWAINRAMQVSERAGAIARAIQKAKSPVVAARLVDQLKREIEKKEE